MTADAAPAMALPIAPSLRIIAGQPPAEPGLWLCALRPEAVTGLVELARQVRRLRPGVRLFISAPGAMSEVAALAEATAEAPPPDAGRRRLRSFLTTARPDLVVLLGSALPPDIIDAATRAGAALVLADARLAPPVRGRRWGRQGSPAATDERAEAGPALETRASWLHPFRQRRLRRLLGRFRQILVQDQASEDALRQLGVAPDRIEVTGPMAEVADPMPCTEAERAALATLLHARPVWLAVGVPEAEAEWVLSAHIHALRHAHRLLLILVPDRPTLADSIAAHCAGSGLICASRAQEEEPEDDVQVLIAEDMSELGLWYRLAPVTWMGGTLRGLRSTRSPLEPAALGSAIVQGPRTAPFSAAYARLAAARAVRLVAGPAALADAVADLIAPDKVATLAHNAWAVTSVGAGAAEAAARAVLATLDAATRPEER
ncbi:3-deoxy-D-manno-octulosonic acid transferase [Phaeovulum veldkampii]|nr:glycosyltransferase N-terminal domain-containing protein [Phaeovulum veldkampii]